MSRDQRNAAVAPMRSTAVDRPESARSTEVDLEIALRLLNESIDETGHTIDSLAAHFKQIGSPKDRSYIAKVRAGKKPLSYEFIVGLPDDVEAVFEQKRARHFGFVVASVPASREEALTCLFSGLAFSLSPTTLPARADQMARAALPVAAKKEIA